MIGTDLIDYRSYGNKLVFHSAHLAPGWRKLTSGKDAVTFYYAGWLYGISWNSLLVELKQTHQAKIIERLSKLKGEFGFFFSGPKFAVALTDHISSYPILIAKIDDLDVVYTGDMVLADRDLLRLCRKSLDIFKMSGYTIGEATLYENSKRLPVGHYAFKENSDRSAIKIYPTKNAYPERASRHRLNEQALIHATFSAFDKALSGNNGRQIAIPMSAGYDSRVVLSAIVELGYENIITYSYGAPHNYEALIAKTVANRLKIPWFFIESTPGLVAPFMRSELFERFRYDSSDGISAPIYHDLYVTHRLMREEKVNEDTIFINGNSGDFISGAHLPQLLTDSKADHDIDEVVNMFIQKHFKLWEGTEFDSIYPIIFTGIKREFQKYSCMKTSEFSYAWERIEFENRQTKNVIKRQKIYDWLGFSWRLPLWDSEYIRLWTNASLEQKTSQNLYKKTFIKKDYQNIWTGIRFNESKFVSPPVFRWLIRPVGKIVIGSICGRQFWRKFDKRFITYFTDNSGLQAIYRYSEVIRFPTFRNYISLHVKNFVEWRKFPK